VPHTICYSVKANSNLSILGLLAQKGCGFDVVSGGELQRVLFANRGASKKVVFSGVGKTVAELALALKTGILMFNVESASELLALSKCATELKKNARIALRVNPDVPAETHPYISTGLHQHKFGIPIQQARELCLGVRGDKYLRVNGVSVHIGSQITDVAPFAATMERVAHLVRDLRSDGHKVDYVDAGGGLGIPYETQAQSWFEERVNQYAAALSRPLRRLKVHLLLEPGRSIVGPAGLLLTRVIYRKKNGDKTFLIVDAAMNDLIRPSLYKAYHEIVPVEQGGVGGETVDVVGPVCESGDFFARDRQLPKSEEGDLFALLDAGAYGMSLSSNYNTRPRAAEILVDGKFATIIRERETIKDLLKLER
jgi:diaminopimelate decarboxylase